MTDEHLVYVPPVLTFKNFKFLRTQCLYTRIRWAEAAARTAGRESCVHDFSGET